MTAGSTDDALEVFGSCAAAALYRREMLDDIRVRGEVFDADFSSYFEDADLDWRAVLAGWSCLHVPEAVAWHERGGSGGEALVRVKKDMIRNHLLMMVKNDRLGMIIADLPYIAMYWIRMLGRMLTAPRLFGGLFAALVLLPRMLGKRWRIQKKRTVSNREMRSWFVDLGLREKVGMVLQRATGGRND